MKTGAFNILIIIMIYLGFVFFTSRAFEVIQPQTQTVNPDGSALISCEHTANDSEVEDVRLYGTSHPRTRKDALLCQKGMKHCKDVVMYPESHNKCLFIILNIGEEAMNMLYQCEITVKKKNDVDITKRGASTRLLQGQGKTGRGVPPPQPPPQPPVRPPLVSWILVGLLALMFLYSCVITFSCIRLRSSGSSDPENSTYVEMRKGPVPRNPASYIYYG